MRGKVVFLMRPVEAILGEHPGKWVVLIISPDQKMGQFVASADSIMDSSIQEAISRERSAGRATALLYSGDLIPAGSVVIL